MLYRQLILPCQGTAEVVFARRTDAIAAIKRYNNVQLDGKPMKIDIIGDTQTTPAPPFLITDGILRAPPRVDTQTPHAPPLPITDGILGAPPRVYIRYCNSVYCHNGKALQHIIDP